MSEIGTPSFESLLAAWGPGVAAGPPRPGVHRNDVRLVTLRGVSYIGRRSGRSAESLGWEHALLDKLAAEGIAVPRPVPNPDGATHVGGLTLTPRLDGAHPSSAEDWAKVTAMLRRVHELTVGWPQRPDVPDWSRAGESEVRGWAAAGGLDPDRAVAYARARSGLSMPAGVTVGRTRRPDITITDAGPAVVDWDEARVDAQALDFVGDPMLAEQSGLNPELRAALERCDRLWTALRGLPPASAANVDAPEPAPL